MGPFQRILGRIRTTWQRRVRLKQVRRERSQFILEPLEPRVLLSADLIGQLDLLHSTPPAVFPAEASAFSVPLFSQIEDQTAASIRIDLNGGEDRLLGDQFMEGDQEAVSSEESLAQGKGDLLTGFSHEMGPLLTLSHADPINKIGDKIYFEPLDPRLLLSADSRLNGLVAHWIGGRGPWSDPTHWDIGVVPNNSGGNTYSVVIDLPGTDPVITIDQNVTISGLINAEKIDVQAGTFNVSGTTVNAGIFDVVGTSSTAIFSNDVTNTGTISAMAGTLRFSGATVSNTGHAITIDGGTVEITNSTISGGTLQAMGAGGTVSVLTSSTLDGVALDSD